MHKKLGGITATPKLLWKTTEKLQTLAAAGEIIMDTVTATQNGIFLLKKQQHYLFYIPLLSEMRHPEKTSQKLPDLPLLAY